MTRLHTIVAEGGGITLDLDAGHIRCMMFDQGGRQLALLHIAPWVDDPAITADESLPANLRHLAGDFFCAPFSTSDVEAAPPHGWPANSAWQVVESIRTEEGATALFRLDKLVLGSIVEKRFTLRHGQPFLYQTHTFRGGVGAIPVANHAMVALPQGGRLAFSAKRRIETPDTPLERDPSVGRSLLTYPATTSDPTKLAMADGSFVDITRYPFADRHEDFVTLVEAPDRRLAWFAASRPASGDAMLSLKNPREFPVTFLWFSNGGRDYAPWNGRHVGVLGVEEGRSYSLHGHRASIEANAWSQEGIPTALHLAPDAEVSVRNVIGAVPLSPGGAPIRDLQDRGGTLALAFEDGAETIVGFDSAFLEP